MSAPIALRGLLAGAFFGVDATIPLSLSVQHGYGATAAGLPLAASGISWAAGVVVAGPGRRQPAVRSVRVRLIRAGFVLRRRRRRRAWRSRCCRRSAGWLAYPAWLAAGLGAGLTMSSVSVLLLKFTTDADRGADSAALQLSDATANALTTGLAGVLVAAAARGALGFTTAFVGLDLTMCADRRRRRPRGGAGPAGDASTDHLTARAVNSAAMPYLDHAATTPMLPEAIEAVAEAHGCTSATPRRCTGRARGRAPPGRGVARDARRGASARARPRSSSPPAAPSPTTSRVKGIYWARRDADPRRRRVIVSAVEHHAVLDAAEWLAAHEGARLTGCRSTAPARSRPTRSGRRIDANPDDVALISVMWANNEVGTIQPIRRAGRDRPRARHPDAQRRRAGRRRGAGRLRGLRRSTR